METSEIQYSETIDRNKEIEQTHGDRSLRNANTEMLNVF